MSGLKCRLCQRVHTAFPLTLALSLRERGQQSRVPVSPRVLLANPASGFAVGRKTILPLPEGEGRGEGEGNELQSLALLFAQRVAIRP